MNVLIYQTKKSKDEYQFYDVYTRSYGYINVS